MSECRAKEGVADAGEEGGGRGRRLSTMAACGAQNQCCRTRFEKGKKIQFVKQGNTSVTRTLPACPPCRSPCVRTALRPHCPLPSLFTSCAGCSPCSYPRAPTGLALCSCMHLLCTCILNIDLACRSLSHSCANFFVFLEVFTLALLAAVPGYRGGILSDHGDQQRRMPMCSSTSGAPAPPHPCNRGRP